MVFSSPLFLFLFLPLVLAGSLLFRRFGQNAFLAAASLVFYAWGEPTWAPIFFCSIAGNYVFGLLVAKASQKNLVLGLGVAANLAALALFKYGDFASANAAAVLEAAGVQLSPREPTHLPIGISFFTFHAISYLVDVRRGKVAPQRSPIDFALYVSLFPQLVAGPIVRYHEIESQLGRRDVTLTGFAGGVRRFVVGLGKKVLVANTLAVPADQIFQLSSSELTAPVAWLGAALYTLQIYFDFSAYSDMAIGLGHLFGFTLPENFDYPYVSRSVTEFWRRWHQSLSRFFRDYVYLPLGGNRRGGAVTYRNLLIVFFLCGLWHGANWTFVVWGLYHGGLLVLERRGFSRVLERIPSALRHAYVMLTVLVGWVFFRVDTLDQGLSHLAAMAGAGHGDPAVHHPSLYLENDVVVAVVVAVAGSTPVLSWLARKRGIAPRVFAATLEGLEAVAVVALLVLSAAWLASGTYNPFIYFRF